MKKTFLAIIASAAFMLGCGEAGVQSDISQNVEIDPINVQLSVPTILVGQRVNQTPPVNVSTGVIDISSDEFSEYLSDATRFTVNEITFSIENFPSGSEADLDISADISIAGGAPVDLLSTVVTDAQNNVTDVVLYPAGSANAAGIAALEQALLNGQSFEMDIELVGRDVLLAQSTIDFDLIFKFDVTARVQFD